MLDGSPLVGSTHAGFADVEKAISGYGKKAKEVSTPMMGRDVCCRFDCHCRGLHRRGTGMQRCGGFSLLAALRPSEMSPKISLPRTAQELCHTKSAGCPNRIDKIVRRNPLPVLGRRKFGSVPFSLREVYCLDRPLRHLAGADHLSGVDLCFVYLDVSVRSSCPSRVLSSPAFRMVLGAIRVGN